MHHRRCWRIRSSARLSCRPSGTTTGLSRPTVAGIDDKIDSRIVAMVGDHDPDASFEQMQRWGSHLRRLPTEVLSGRALLHRRESPTDQSSDPRYSHAIEVSRSDWVSHSPARSHVIAPVSGSRIVAGLDRRADWLRNRSPHRGGFADPACHPTLQRCGESHRDRPRRAARFSARTPTARPLLDHTVQNARFSSDHPPDGRLPSISTLTRSTAFRASASSCGHRPTTSFGYRAEPHRKRSNVMHPSWRGSGRTCRSPHRVGPFTALGRGGAD